MASKRWYRQYQKQEAAKDLARAKFSGLNKLCKCGCCGMKTHSSIDGNVGIELCRTCYESAGLQNEHSDRGHATRKDDCPSCQGVDCLHEIGGKK